MTRLPWQPGATLAWRLDAAAHASTWDSGVGGLYVGGRWNPQGFATVYCSLDPATAILEAAVHKQFATLERVPHVLTWCRINDPERLFVVQAEDLPDPAWLHSGPPARSQQAHGMHLMSAHGAFVVPSVVSTHSWNLVFSPAGFSGRYAFEHQERFGFDARLNR